MILIENRTKSLGRGYNASPLRLINLSLAAGLIFAPFTAHSAFATPLSEQPVTWIGTLEDPGDSATQPACTIVIVRDGTFGFDVSKGKVDSFSQDFTDGDGGAAGVNPQFKVINNLKAGDALKVSFTAPSFLRDGADVSNEFLLEVGIGSKPAEGDRLPINSLLNLNPLTAGTSVPKNSAVYTPPIGPGPVQEVWLQGTYYSTESAPTMPPGKYSAKSTLTCEPSGGGTSILSGIVSGLR